MLNNDIKTFYNANPYPFAGNYRDFFERHIFKHVKYHDPKVILDAGCGTGNITADIARLFPQARVIGVDFAPNAIAIALKRFAHVPNLSFTCADLRKSLDLEASIDLIYCQGVLHHIDDPEQVLNVFKSSLRATGIAVVWLYNPYGRRFISDLIRLERLLLGPDHALSDRLRAVHELEQWLTSASRSRWIESHVIGVEREGLRAFLSARLKDAFMRKRESEARRIADERKLIDRYLNPSACYYTIDDAEHLFRKGGFALVDILEFPAQKRPKIIERSAFHALLENRSARWRVLEVLERPRGLTYVLHRSTEAERGG